MSSERTASQISVTAARVAEWIGDDASLQLIDVREGYERAAGHIEASRHIALTSLPSEAATLARERPVVLYCRVGNRSDMAAQALRTAGFEAYSLEGGLVSWTQEGRPLVPEGGYVADH